MEALIGCAHVKPLKDSTKAVHGGGAQVNRCELGTVGAVLNCKRMPFGQ